MNWLNLIGPGNWAGIAATHGLLACILLVSFAGSFEALFAPTEASVRRLKIGGIAMSSAAILTVFYGTWLYTAFAPTRTWLNKNAPIFVHGMDFKEFLGLFTVPLATAAAYAIWKLGNDLIPNKRARMLVLSVVTMAFVYTAVAFGLGAAITKMKAV